MSLPEMSRRQVEVCLGTWQNCDETSPQPANERSAAENEPLLRLALFYQRILNHANVQVAGCGPTVRPCHTRNKKSGHDGPDSRRPVATTISYYVGLQHSLGGSPSQAICARLQTPALLDGDRAQVSRSASCSPASGPKA